MKHSRYSSAMPELPEVENARLSLERLGCVGQKFDHVELKRKDLRFPFPPALNRNLKGQTLLSIKRRAKYLLFETEKYYLINHLGMTGFWRSENPVLLQKHDHVIFHFQSGLRLVFNDPRRFGLLDLAPKSELHASRWLKHLGLEPLELEFNSTALFQATRKLKAPIKSFIMDQRRVVGVGNIYASEALHASGVRPSRPAGKLTRDEAGKLVTNIQEILKAAIAAGGSTIRDYRNSEGESGSFQQRFKVYGRDKEPCPTCAKPIRARNIGGRNTFWCPQCQR